MQRKEEDGEEGRRGSCRRWGEAGRHHAWKANYSKQLESDWHAAAPCCVTSTAVAAARREVECRGLLSPKLGERVPPHVLRARVGVGP